MHRLIFAVSCAVFACQARAFTFHTPISDGCHEEITLEALEKASWPDGQVPSPLTREEQLIADTVPFRLDEELDSGLLLALIVGVRDNDLHGSSASDLPGLAAVHSDPDGQDEHCLRASEDDGPDGDRTALLHCRAFILDAVSTAIGSAPLVDTRTTTALDVWLAYRATTEVELPRFGVYMGRALHALQDSFTHTLREPGEFRVRHVLNFVDHAEGEYVEERDGVQHIGALDLCDDPPAGEARVERATEASAALLRAVADGTGGPSGRLERAERVLDDYLELQPGCTADNRWCNAEELDFLTGGCSAAHPTPVSNQSSAPLIIILILTLAGFARPALAETSTSSVSEKLVKPRSDEIGKFGVVAGISGALDKTALAASVGGRWHATNSITLGLDSEINPWISIPAARFARGSWNTYAVFIYRWWSIGDVDLRFTLKGGTSVLLFDLVGADAGSTGIFLGGNLLGVALHIDEHLKLILDPADVAVPIPQIGDIPFFYLQYRFTVSFEWTP